MKRVIVCALIALYAVAVTAAFLAGIWSGDARWGLTGLVGLAVGALTPPVICAAYDLKDRP